MLAFVDDIFGDVAEVLDALCVFHVCSLCGKCYGVYGVMVSGLIRGAGREG